MNKRILTAVVAVVAMLGLAGCVSAADRANENLTRAAENFEVPRRIVGINGINGITDEVLFSVEGFCSYETGGGTFEAICLVDRASGAVERTTLGLSDNVTFVSTQTGGKEVDLFQPRVIFRPEAIVPDFDLSTSARLQGNGNG
jgi:hypothetical protein